LVVNVYTERAWRRSVVVADGADAGALAVVPGEQDRERSVLHPCEGRPLYEKLGFTPTNEMRYDGSL